MSGKPEAQKQLKPTLALLDEVAKALNADIAIELWDGTRVPLGSNPAPDLAILIKDPGIIASLLRRPGLDRIIRPYIKGLIEIKGGTLYDVGLLFALSPSRKRLKKIPKRTILSFLTAFLFSPGVNLDEGRAFEGDENNHGKNLPKSNEIDFIQFHYDVGNDFYELFLDERRLYSCAYFTDWNNSLDQAQHDKIDMICRKLRLKPEERFLDIGCGWGALIFHAAEKYGVRAHGVTLSEAQLTHVREQIKAKGLEDRVSVELKNYVDLEGPFDKIASVGMMEHVGEDNLNEYCATINRLLVDKGLFLNHAISRKAKKKKNRFSSRPEQRALQKYIFPGGELIDLGQTISSFEQNKFEVMDVEGWREHYQLTTKLWLDRLETNRDKAVELVGEEVYRIWIAYLAGSSLAFLRGTARLYQVLVSKNPKGPANLPPSRADLYR
ncbi:SAM-dependent methyltransferase [Cohaesibacter gelatinilyticus]|uniref:Cyclopropane-fatty-acyl-phospholipid synthase n=1 Tax=Cohaesibacter gelatinilyticus TaxID=372072 RepID=A0A285PC31_9HYPH|nr:cyclopropane-fatty-acyl-phospholipid synthase family protein [Cohaesibacter gelatinilyticus]SNZ19320.1 cyclopropane-fatty-acyl-phospholipid synthase [Cohaesibacter gelatinilyticus]